MLSPTCSAAGQSVITSAACLRALLALCSPSAAITLALASRAASASAAMALWSCSGTLTSFTSTLSTLTPQGSVASSNADWSWYWYIRKYHYTLLNIFWNIFHTVCLLFSVSWPKIYLEFRESFLISAEEIRFKLSVREVGFKFVLK